VLRHETSVVRHVSNILAKLGVGSRGEAAAKAHDSHLFDTP